MTAVQVIGSYSDTGGVTKTATALSIAVAAADAGEDVVIIDGDPRAATTKWTGATPKRDGFHFGAILGNKDPEGYAEELAVNLDPSAGWPANLRVVPSARSVANYEKSADDHADVRLRQALIGLNATLVVFDFPNRQGGLITQNGLTAVDTLLYAAMPNEDGLDGVDGAKLTVKAYKDHRAAIGAVDNIHEAGIVLGSAYIGGVWSRDAKRAVEEFERTSPGMLLTPYIQHRMIVKESRSAGEWYGKYELGHPVRDAYREIYRKVRK